MTHSDSREPAWPVHGLADAVAALRHSREVANKVRFRGSVRELPSRSVLQEVVHGLIAALFPTHFGPIDLTDDSIDYFVGNVLNASLSALTEQVRRGLRFQPGANIPEAELAQAAIEITRLFTSELHGIRALIVSDLLAAYQGDPAAASVSEILIAYPGIAASIHHRFAHALHQRGAGLVARLISSIAQSQTGIDIHPATTIGRGFFIDHGTGVVIGETAIIGNNVRLYQAVTLGAKRFAVDEDGNLVKGGARHPIVEDNVVIYSGATILGRITIGRGSTIGGNVWLTHSVPPGSHVTQARTSIAPNVEFDHGPAEDATLASHPSNGDHVRAI